LPRWLVPPLAGQGCRDTTASALAGSSGPAAASAAVAAEPCFELRLQSPTAWAVASDDEWLTTELGR
jgi:hypothetical protein